MGDSFKKRIIVVGGGFAGLSAASELSLHDSIDVTIVEAADYLGRTGLLFSYLLLVTCYLLLYR